MDDKGKKTGQRTKKQRLEFCHDWQKRLESSYRDLKTMREEALKYRDSDPSIVECVEGRSKVTTTDMQDAIDMAKPDILEQIAGIDEPLKLDPDEARYVEAAKKLQVLGNVMVKRKNPWFRICSDFLDDSMVFKFGCIKYRWVVKKTDIEKVFEDLTDMEFEALKAENPKASVASDETTDGKRITKLKYPSDDDEYVQYSVVPSERIRFPLDTKTFNETPIVIEEIRLYEHDFREQYGDEAFEKVKGAVDEIQKPDKDFLSRFKHLGDSATMVLDHFYDTISGRYKAYEAYFYEKKTPWMMVFTGDEVFQDEENKYGKPPYRGGSPFLIAHSLIGKGYIDVIKEIQRQRTTLKRQLFDVILQNNHRRNFVNLELSGMNIEDYENNSAMDALIRCTGVVGPETIMPEPKVPLSPENFTFWELLNTEKDSHTPTPRAYGGLEGAKDEKTYRGKQLKVTQASKKLLMMVRAYMEEVWGPLFQDTLDCIAKFMKKKTVVRYLNEDYEIDPEEIICKYALIVNVGLGSHDKQDLIVKLQQLIGLALQQVALGIYTPQNLFYINSELVKAMGFLNTMDFVTDPKLKEVVMQLAQTIQAMFQEMSQLPELQGPAHAIMQQLMPALQKLMAAVGIQEENEKGGKNSKGTANGEQPAKIQEQPAEAMAPQTEMTGEGYWA